MIFAQLDLAKTYSTAHFTAQKMMASCFLFEKKEKHSIWKLFTNQPYIQNLNRLKLQTTILIEDECIDTDEEPMLHSNNTVRPMWPKSETEHNQHTDEHPSEHLSGLQALHSFKWWS